MATRRLTDECIKTLPIPPLRNGKPSYDLHWDAGRGAVANMALRITTGGARSWVLVARFPSSKRADGRHNPTARKIGRWPDVRLPAAREIADGWNQDIRRGIDPQEKAEAEARAKRAAEEERQREEARKRAGTFSNISEEYVRRVASKLRTGHDLIGVIQRDLIPRWGDKPIAEISKTDVIDLVEDVSERGQYAAAAAYKAARGVFNWCLEREDPRHPKLGIVASPCANLRIDKLIGKLKARQHTLNEKEIALVWQATESDDPLIGYPLDPYIRLLLILGVRRNELAQATWDEFDLADPAKATWTLEHTRTKNQEPRTIPLPRLATDIIAALPRFTGGPYVFSANAGRTPITNFSRLKENIDRKITALGAPIRSWRLHDLRRSARSNWSALSIPPLICELMLGHAQRGIIAVYDTHRYLDEQREGYEKWCARLRAITEPAPDNVVRMPMVRA
jgi:integrase